MIAERRARLQQASRRRLETTGRRFPAPREAAAAGAAFLDAVRPGWWQQIDVMTLDIASSCRCILGQLYGRYWDGMDALELEPSDAVELGFEAVQHEDEIALTAAWIAEILARRFAPTATDETTDAH